MAGHRPFRELYDRLPADRRARIEADVRQEMERLLLTEIRALMGLTQADVAQELDVSQSAVSQWESQSDMRISTLRRIIEALGGELEIIAHLPTGKIAVSPFSEERKKATARGGG